MITQCPSCGALNRINLDHAHSAKCGKCKNTLYNGKPIEMNQAQFNRAKDKTEETLIVDFWAPWCGPCQQFAPVFSTTASEIEPNARFIKIDTEQEQLLASQLGIRSIPTLAVFKNGQEVTRMSGAMSQTQFSQWVKQFI